MTPFATTIDCLRTRIILLLLLDLAHPLEFPGTHGALCKARPLFPFLPGGVLRTGTSNSQD